MWGESWYGCDENRPNESVEQMEDPPSKEDIKD